MSFPADLSEFVAPLLNISTEGRLQEEIKDIIDELSIMLYLTTQQLEVIKSFVNHVSKMLDPKYQVGSPPAGSPTSPTSAGGFSASPDSGNAPDSSKKRNFDWFTRMSADLVNSVEDGLAELMALKESAKSTSESVCSYNLLHGKSVSI